ncbi:S-methyl-5-thioribose kinase [Clostridium cylindrosporum]|uniref:S-methyl-5-thioribose kinase n=1 Tax=Clostridium cylindrosporum DSM 605 TaxID=1121307 RepID=A0A0J8DDZ7_CLOCY|nr:S-methyl-5-thioribose kinase [Clostridium cylindrosporum]KMT22449.1 methylthioribose kinase MtnK [Clostridium cylindrosporum DSM 605]
MGERFKVYEILNEKSVIDYVKVKLDYFTEESSLISTEIGDGNLNYVYRVVDTNTKKSIIIKQSTPEARISSDIKVSVDRNRIEYEMLSIQNKYAKGLVPEVYGYDNIMNLIIMEDLSDYNILRGELVSHKRFNNFSDNITDFLVNTLLLTSDVVLDSKEKKELQGKFINPDLCEITENYVYTYPFVEDESFVFPPMLEFVKEEIWGDKRLLLEISKLKFDFLTKGQALIHGDLHTGSIFVKEGSIKVIDPEFGFYGPIGYDLGNVIANLLFAYQNADKTIDNIGENEDYKIYIESLVKDIIYKFKLKFSEKWDEFITETSAKVDGFKEYYLNSILSDSFGVAGTEIIRRIVGIAKVKDITVILDNDKRAEAEKFLLTLGKRFILERDNFKGEEDFINALHEVEKQF